MNRLSPVSKTQIKHCLWSINGVGVVVISAGPFCILEQILTNFLPSPWELEKLTLILLHCFIIVGSGIWKKTENRHWFNVKKIVYISYIYNRKDSPWMISCFYVYGLPEHYLLILEVIWFLVVKILILQKITKLKRRLLLPN